jgi:hypothetical protein
VIGNSFVVTPKNRLKWRLCVLVACTKGSHSLKNSFHYQKVGWRGVTVKMNHGNASQLSQKMLNKAKQHRSLRSLDSLAVALFVHGFAIIAQKSQQQVCRCWQRYISRKLCTTKMKITK